MTPEERRNYALEMFRQNPELYPAERRQPILDGKVVTGMKPFEARLAGGAFQYRVSADPAVWPPHTDPLKVMWAQSLQADESEIAMTFSNTTLFDTEQPVTFRVDFLHGDASRIERLEQQG